jgi:flavodoxin
MAKIAIVYSSKTGNTKKVAEGIASALGGTGTVCDLIPVAEAEMTAGKPDYAVYLAGFWVDKGTADPQSLKFLEGLQGVSVGLFGTLGAYPDSGHAKDVEKRMETLVSAKNKFLGCFLCQGKIDPALTEQFKKFPEGHPHAMDEERMARHIEAAKHPDDADIANAAAACTAMLKRAGAI